MKVELITVYDSEWSHFLDFHSVADDNGRKYKRLNGYPKAEDAMGDDPAKMWDEICLELKQ